MNKEIQEQILELTKHNIPFYAYGDNEAACELSRRLNEVASIASQVEPEVMQKIAKGILDDLINEFTPTECVAAHVFYDRLQISVSGIIDEELGKLKAIEFTNKQTFDSLVNFAEQLKKRF